MSIFNGIDAMLDEWLGIAGNQKFGTRDDVPRYASKTACIAVSEAGGSLQEIPGSLVQRCLDRMEENFEQLAVEEIPASNWEWEKSLHLASHNPSQEKTLEKATAFLLVTVHGYFSSRGAVWFAKWAWRQAVR